MSRAIAASLARQLLERGLTLRDVADILGAHPRAVRALLTA